MTGNEGARTPKGLLVDPNLRVKGQRFDRNPNDPTVKWKRYSTPLPFIWFTQ